MSEARLIKVLSQVVPQWPEKLRRRWARQFLPLWREDLVPPERMTRYLTLALRRGWFDSPESVGQWSHFICLLEQTQGRPSPQAGVNLFNLAALIPGRANLSPEHVMPEHWRALCGEHVLDARQMTDILRALKTHLPELGAAPAQQPVSAMVRVHRGAARDERGQRWLAGLGGQGWTLLHVVEPFGMRSWDGVSQAGVDEQGVVAYSRPLGLTARLVPPNFAVDVVHGEPSRALKMPGATAHRLAGMRTLFQVEARLWAGVTRDGAVAFLEREG